jgi:membrane-associated phospholipid phosphatase
VVIAMRSPRWGSIAIVSAALIAFSLPLVNAHWLSDVVAGGFLGAVVGKGTLSFADRLPSNTTLND